MLFLFSKMILKLSILGCHIVQRYKIRLKCFKAHSHCRLLAKRRLDLLIAVKMHNYDPLDLPVT